MPEYKTLPAFTKAIEGRTVTGIFAVHGNIDDGQDMSVNGSFAKRLQDGARKRIRFLWNHNSLNPPIATIKSVREVDREGLPESVLKFAPEATGGVEVAREYYEGVPLADWVFKGLAAGDIDEMSYAYDVHETEIQDVDGKQIRLLKDVEIFDISDVNWGMNPATAGIKGLAACQCQERLKAPPAPGELSFSEHFAAVVSAVEEYTARVKNRNAFGQSEGGELSAANRKSLQDLIDQLDELLSASQPKASQLDLLQALTRYQALLARYSGVPIGA